MAWACYPHWNERLLQQVRGAEILRASVWEAVSFETVTLTRLSSGVPDRCQILGTAGSNPWPSDCRWASVPNQTKSGSAGRCSLLCFLWYRNLCWSGIKQYSLGASLGNSFHHHSLRYSEGIMHFTTFGSFLNISCTTTELNSCYLIIISILNSNHSQSLKS